MILTTVSPISREDRQAKQSRITKTSPWMACTRMEINNDKMDEGDETKMLQTLHSIIFPRPYSILHLKKGRVTFRPSKNSYLVRLNLLVKLQPWQKLYS